MSLFLKLPFWTAILAVTFFYGIYRFGDPVGHIAAAALLSEQVCGSTAAENVRDAIVAARPLWFFVLIPCGVVFALCVLGGIGLVRRQISVSGFGYLLCGHTACLLGTFALTYHLYDYGIGPAGKSVWQGLYFAIVTWTTLGYGDISPPDGLQLLAAFEAFLGYAYLGLFVTWLAAAVGPPIDIVTDQRQKTRIKQLEDSLKDKDAELKAKEGEIERLKTPGPAEQPVKRPEGDGEKGS